MFLSLMRKEKGNYKEKKTNTKKLNIRKTLRGKYAVRV